MPPVELVGTQENGGLLTGATPTATLTVPAGTTVAGVMVITKSTASTGSLTVTLNGASPNVSRRDGNPDTVSPLLSAAIYFFYSPSAGAQTLALTHGTAPTGTNQGSRWVGVYFTSRQVAAVGTSAIGTSNNPNVNYTGVETGGIILAACAHEGASIMTAKGTGQVGAGADADGFVDEGNWNSAFTYEIASSGDGDTQSFTNSANDTYVLVVIGNQPLRDPPDLVMPPMRPV